MRKNWTNGLISCLFFFFFSSLLLLTLKYPLSRTGSETPSNEEWAEVVAPSLLLLFLAALRVIGADVRRLPLKHGAAEVEGGAASATRAARSRQSTALRAMMMMMMLLLLFVSF